MISRKLKSLFIILTIGLMVVGVAAWKFAVTSRAEAPHMERYLPATTLAFIQVHDLREQTLHIADSDAWKEFSKSNPSASSLFLMAANHTGLLDASYAVAVTGVTVGNGEPEPNFALIAEFSSEDTRRSFERRILGPLQHAGGSNNPAKTEDYGNVHIKVIGSGTRDSAAYAQVGNLLILANNVDTVKSIVDAHDGKIKTLGENPQLAQARSHVGYNDGMFGFVDGVAMTNLIDNVPVKGQNAVSMFRELFHASGADSTQSVAMTSSFANGRVVERFTIVTKDGGHGALHSILNNPGTKQELLNLVPFNADAVADVSIANAQQTFEDLTAMVNKLAAEHGQHSTDDLFQDIFNQTGIDVRNDIVQSLGSEACLADLNIDGKHAPTVILAVADQDKFNHVMEMLAQKAKKTITSQDYQGIQIKSAAVEKEGSVSYAFVNGNYVASSNLIAVQQIIDTAKNGKSLSASDAYRGAASQLNVSPQFVFYGSNNHYLQEMSEMIPGQNKELKTTAADTNLAPSFAFGVARPDGLYVESYSPLGTFPHLLGLVTSKLAADQSVQLDQKK
jgi:hypothetical protein